MFKPEVKKSKKSIEYIKKMKKSLGPMKRNEKIVAFIFIAALFLWITERYNPYNAGLMSLILSLILFIPGISILRIGKFSGNLPWSSLFVFAASMYLAKIVGQTNAMNPVADSMFKYTGLSVLSPTILLLLTISMAVMFHLVFTSTTVYATVVMPLVIAIAKICGISAGMLTIPVAFAVPLALILPANTIPNMIFYSSGYFNYKQIIKYGIILSLISIVTIIIFGIPYWMYIGLI
jgi:anion transporter